MIGMYLQHRQRRRNRIRRNILLRISRIPEGIEPTSPRRDPALIGEADNRKGAQEARRDNGAHEQILELLGRQVAAHELRERNDLQQAEHAKRGHVFASAHRLETDEGDLHTRKRSHRVP